MLDESISKHSSPALSNRVRNYILNLVNMRRFEIKPLQLFDQPWPYWFDPNDLSLSTRTRNCLAFAGLLADRGQLSKVSFGKLFEIRSMGVVSILEFACTAETALGKTRDSVPENTGKRRSVARSHVRTMGGSDRSSRSAIFRFNSCSFRCDNYRDPRQRHQRTGSRQEIAPVDMFYS